MATKSHQGRPQSPFAKGGTNENAHTYCELTPCFAKTKLSTDVTALAVYNKIIGSMENCWGSLAVAFPQVWGYR